MLNHLKIFKNSIFVMFDLRFLCFGIIYIICLRFGWSKSSFAVELQSSGEWSKDQVIKYQGNIEELKEFTICYWERNKYFSHDSSTIWSYCFIENKNDTDWKCVQLYYRGNRSLANTEVNFRGYFYGWTKNSINIIFPTIAFRHRSWNHVCWSYSSLTGKNRLFYNGFDGSYQ